MAGQFSYVSLRLWSYWAFRSGFIIFTPESALDQISQSSKENGTNIFTLNAIAAFSSSLNTPIKSLWGKCKWGLLTIAWFPLLLSIHWNKFKASMSYNWSLWEGSMEDSSSLAKAYIQCWSLCTSLISWQTASIKNKHLQSFKSDVFNCVSKFIEKGKGIFILWTLLPNKEAVGKGRKPWILSMEKHLEVVMLKLLCWVCTPRNLLVNFLFCRK